MNGNPTAAQRRFHKWCRVRGCIITGSSNPALHHIKGSKMKLKGVDNAGEWFVLPVCYWWHQDGDNPNAIHINRSNFTRTLYMTEKDWWVTLINEYKDNFMELPMSEEEYQIIVDRA